jgi:acetyltransferase-like isoleucine patch superfamily enzyme
MLRAVAAQARRQLDTAERGLYAARRLRWLAQMRLAAERVHADLELDVAPDVALGRRLRVTFEPGSRNRLVVGPGSRICDDFLLRFSGGSAQFGPRVEIRRGVSLNVGGDLVLRGDNLVSWFTAFHCSSRIEVDRMTIIGEHATITDSSHYWTTPEEHVWHNLRSGEVYVGVNTWLAAKVTIARGAHVGACCLVGASSVVVGDVPDASFASGIPAVVRPLPVPWVPRPADAAEAGD